ncbi:MAG: hypothetical protein ACR2K2_07660 [Mycobacteriales bacterium]
MKLCWSNDAATARQHLHRLWGHTAIPGEASQILPSPAHFEQLRGFFDFWERELQPALQQL